MAVKVAFSPEAEADLLALYDYISKEAAAAIAAKFTGEIIDFCEGFSTFPNRGTRRDDLRPGLRIVGFRRQVTVAFAVDGDVVSIIGVYYGGRDIEEVLRDAQ